LQHNGQTNKAVQKKKSGWLCFGVVTLHDNARLQFFGPFQSPTVELTNWLHTFGMDAHIFAEGFDALVSH